MYRYLLQINVCILSCLVAFAGCRSEPEIRQYKVARKSQTGVDSRVDVAASPERTVAAIIPQPKQAWFVKLKGEHGRVSLLTELVKSFVESITFGADGQPSWKLPDGWRQKAGDGFVFASIFPAGDDSLKITVSQLPLPPGELTTELWHGYVEQNVNRWRGQLNLPDDTWGKMIAYIQTIDKKSLGSADAFFVVLDGTSSGDAMAPPMFGAGMRGPRRFDNQIPETPKLSYKVPQGWKESQASMMRIASFLVEQGGKSADISISTAGGDIRDNVDRWQRQLIPNAPDDRVKQVIESAQEVSVNNVASQVYYLTNDSSEEKKAILAAIIPWQPANSLFVKLSGPASIAEANRQQFIELLSTLKW